MSRFGKSDASTSMAGKAAAKATKKAAASPVKKWIKRTIFGFFAFFLLAVIAATGLFLFEYWRTEVPTPNKVAQAQITTVYYADGKTEMGTFAERNRTIVDTAKLPKYIGQAVIASEDRTFYENSGIDLKGIIRALWNNVRGRPIQGASTLSQQYIENYYVGTTKSYAGKFRETIMALKINQEQSKEEILNNYLNTIYFGRGAYGIEAAAMAYFDKPAKELTLSEAALLSGIIPAPSAWDPAVDKKMAEKRWKRVINHMKQDKWISAKEASEAKFPETVKEKPRSSSFEGTKGYLLQHVRDELKSRAGYNYSDIDSMGLKIITTIQPKRQSEMEEAVKILPGDKPENLRVGMVSIDPKTGGIVAEYGGADFKKIQRSAAYQDIAMAGSTFKPFALVAALEQGIPLSAKFSGSGTVIVNGQAVRNYGHAAYGDITLTRALQMSVNTAFVRLNEDVGPDNTRQVAIRAGYPENTYGLNNQILNVLGTSSPHTVDIAEAFSTFANQGVHIDSHIVAKVVDANGRVVYQPDTRGVRMFQTNVVANLCVAMQAVAEGPISGIGKFDRPVATKTGSSEDNRSAQFVGFVPQLTTAVSMYQVGPHGEEESITPFGGQREITGGTWPAKVWQAYMRAATKGMDVEKFPEPDGEFGKKSPEYKVPKFNTAPAPHKTPNIKLTPIGPIQPRPGQNDNPPQENGNTEGTPPPDEHGEP